MQERRNTEGRKPQGERRDSTGRQNERRSKERKNSAEERPFNYEETTSREEQRRLVEERQKYGESSKLNDKFRNREEGKTKTHHKSGNELRSQKVKETHSRTDPEFTWVYSSDDNGYKKHCSLSEADKNEYLANLYYSSKERDAQSILGHQVSLEHKSNAQVRRTERYPSEITLHCLGAPPTSRVDTFSRRNWEEYGAGGIEKIMYERRRCSSLDNPWGLIIDEAPSPHSEKSSEDSGTWEHSELLYGDSELLPEQVISEFAYRPRTTILKDATSEVPDDNKPEFLQRWKRDLCKHEEEATSSSSIDNLSYSQLVESKIYLTAESSQTVKTMKEEELRTNEPAIKNPKRPSDLNGTQLSKEDKAASRRVPISEDKYLEDVLVKKIDGMKDLLNDTYASLEQSEIQKQKLMRQIKHLELKWYEIEALNRILKADVPDVRDIVILDDVILKMKTINYSNIMVGR